MGKPTGFMEIPRKTDSEGRTDRTHQALAEFKIHGDDKERRAQGARCMDCGTPFCHTGHIVSGMASAAARSTT
jgi:glutamate synthase (NADPH) small chain